MTDKIKKFFVSVFTLLKNRVFVQAVCLVIGSIAMIFGKTISFNDQMIEAVVTISGAFLNLLSFGSALVSETKK